MEWINSMKTDLNLRVSEIPTLIGLNQYGSIKSSVLRLWKQADPGNYYKTITAWVREGKIENPLIRQEDVVTHQSQKYGLGTQIKDKIHTCQQIDNTAQLYQQKEELVKLIQQQNMASNDQKQLIEAVKSLTQTRYGNKHENLAIDLYSQTVGQEVQDQQKKVFKMLAQSQNFRWNITGKVDGIRPDKTLVEIKNRVHKLFNELKEYEHVQVQVYLHLLKLNQGDLVESIKEGDHRKINIITVPYDKKYWKNVVKLRLLKFIEFFNHFIMSPATQMMFLKESDPILNQYFQKEILEGSGCLL